MRSNTDRACIRYCVSRCSLGHLLVAGTEKGLCMLRFGSSEEQLREQLEGEYPYGEFQRERAGRLRDWADAIAGYVDGSEDRIEVPLDVSGSRFQRRVWNALRRIPQGETRSYSEIARTIGEPSAARAVARACATNPAPVVIPCHRVVPKTGGLGGYAGGVTRKRALLRREGMVLRSS